MRAVFENRTDAVAARVKVRVEEIEERFGIRGEVSIPQIPSNRTDYEFDNNLISYLRPQKHRVFLERVLPFEWLHRSIGLPMFEKATIQTPLGGIEWERDAGNTISSTQSNSIFKDAAWQKQEALERFSKGAVDVSNKHIKFVRQSHGGKLLHDYEDAYERYVKEWEGWLVEYQSLVDLAIRVGSNEVQKTITDAVEGLRRRANALRV